MNHCFSRLAALAVVMLLLISGFPLMAQTPSTGLGTYYADKYHGRPTASGELYDKYKFTAAHRTLAFGTMVKVTRPDNGRSVIVKVNDRGPFTEGRIIDLSRAAAEQLDMIRSGEVPVRIEVVNAQAGPAAATPRPSPRPGTMPQPSPPRPATNQPPQTNYNPDNRDLSDLPLRDFSGRPIGEITTTAAPAAGTAQPAAPPALTEAERYTPALFQFVAFKRPSEGYGVQIGAFFSFYRLMEAMDQISAKGIQNTVMHSSLKDGQPIFRILVGPYNDRAEATAMQRSLANKGTEGLVIDLESLE